MYLISSLVFLSYYFLKDLDILSFKPDEFYLTSILFRVSIIVFMLTGMVSIILGGIILRVGWTNERSGWFIGISIGLVSVFVMLSSLTNYWMHILICLIGVGIYIVLYINYLSGSYYKKLSLSIFVFIFLVGFGISVYMLKNNAGLSIVSLVFTYGTTFLAILLNERVYFKIDKSLFII